MELITPKTQEVPIDFKDKKLNRELIFTEEPCEVEIVSGACLRLWIKSTVNGVYHGFAVCLPDSNSVPLFKKAFLHLQELDAD